MDVACPYCGEISGFAVPESYKGNLSCPRCPHSFYVEIEKGKIKLIKQEPVHKWPKSVRSNTASRFAPSGGNVVAEE